MSETTFTHKALADLLGVSETTVKSYRRKFPGCIPVSSKGKPIRFTAEAAAVATRIRDLFETGMSVEEVRLRLSREFGWIAPDQPKTPGRGSAEVSPELSVGVSNMAKSMVAMTQQHKALLSRMQGIESLLEDIGLKGGQEMEETRRRNAAAARERETLLEERLNRLDATTKELADNLASLAGQLDRFLGQRDSAAEAWTNGGASATLAVAAQLMAETAARPAAPVRTHNLDASRHKPPVAAAPELHGSKVIPLHPTVNDGKHPSAPKAAAGQHPGPAAGLAGTNPSEPPRHFFSLPLVVRTGQGQYVSAGGRGRGRFSINDLKAMLVYGYTPPNHFSLRWENHGQGWWLHLEQTSGQLLYQLLLMELPSQKGGNVAEILQVKKNGNALHPAEICAIIDSFGV